MSRAAGAALLGLGLTLAAGLFDSPSLFVPGLTLLLVGGGAVAWVLLASAGARVAREAGPHVVQEEDAWPLTLRFSAGAVPPPGGDLVEPLLAAPIPLAGRARRRARVEVRFSRRGVRRLAAPHALVRDPLRLAERRVSGAGEAEVVVLPRIEPVLGPEGGDAGPALGGTAQRAALTEELELDALRPHRPGAPASRIHWPTVARTGELVERRLVAGAGGRPLVVLDPRGASSEEELDMAVRAAASLAVHLARAGGCSVLLPGERRPVDLDADMRAWPALHVRLALVAGDAPAPAAGRLARPGAIVWVSAAAHARVPAALRRRGVRWVVTPGAPRGGADFTVAGCSGVALAAARVTAPAGGRA